MADPISTIALDNSQVWPIYANSYCMRVTIQENYDSTTPPTADLRQYETADKANPQNGTPANIAKGTPAIFTKGSLYSPGEKVGGMKTATGSITASQVESGQI